MPIQPAKIEFNQQGTPVATSFDDVYFSNADGMQETRYVFLHNNGLPQRWYDWQRKDFVIAETGFGTGLNFLTSWQAFDEYLQQNPDSHLQQLYFVTVEKFPLTQNDLKAALQQWPALKAYADELIEHYPQLTPGCHRLVLAHGKVVLDLWFGDLHEVQPQIYCSPLGLVDAWFLDGFAPSKNPDMWTDELFSNMVRLARQDCTFATFTAAGFVKRGLRDAGFSVEKRKGFGHKRDMLAGQLAEKPAFTSPAPYYQRNSATAQGLTVAIIGAGLAAANLALSISQRGFRVKVYCKDSGPAQGASGNAQGGLYPQLHAQANIASRFYSQAFIYARQRYDQLLKDGFTFAHQWCGVLQLAFNDNTCERYHKLAASELWPASMTQWLDAEACEKIAGVHLPYPGLFIPEGGWINPPQLVQALLDASKAQGDCQVFYNHKLQQLNQTANGWQLNWQQSQQSEADIVILATGSDSPEIEPLTEIPYRRVRGQVEAIPSYLPLRDLKTVLCHKGYLTPALDGYHALGSTYVKNDLNCDYRQDEQQQNLAMHQKALNRCDWVEKVNGEHRGRASIRCSTPDHLPVAGAVANWNLQRKDFADLYKALPPQHYPKAQDYPNLFTLTGLGSRGLCSAPLLAELVASQISNQPLPLAQDLLNALSPNRFLIRQLIRQQP